MKIKDRGFETSRKYSKRIRQVSITIGRLAPSLASPRSPRSPAGTCVCSAHSENTTRLRFDILITIYRTLHIHLFIIYLLKYTMSTDSKLALPFFKHQRFFYMRLITQINDFRMKVLGRSKAVTLCYADRVYLLHYIYFFFHYFINFHYFLCTYIY